MVVYKIRHKETGLFFCPSRKIKAANGRYVKSNLSKTGKIYHNMPSLAWCQHYRSHFHIQPYKESTHYYKSRIFHCQDDPTKDWEIIAL